MSRQPRSGLITTSILIAFTYTICLAQDAKQLPSPPSPGAAIESAAKATAPNYRQVGAVDILTDTEGIDFAPYLKSIFARVRENWYAHIPEPVQHRSGKLAIEFTVESDGHISDMKLWATSGDAILDRLAWDGIRNSNPLPKLPEGFHGPRLVLRCRFYYNPAKNDLTDYAWPRTQDSLQHAVLKQKAADSNVPEYPRDAIDAKVEGVVRLEIKVGIDGRVTNIKPTEGNPMLAESAVRAVQNWRFHPARKEGRKAEDVVRVKVEFRVRDQFVRTEVVLPERDSLPPPQ